MSAHLSSSDSVEMSPSSCITAPSEEIFLILVDHLNS